MRLGQITALWLLASACSSIDGGAVELSWKLRPASGASDLFVDCDSGMPGTGPVTRMRLDWQVADTNGFATWSCNDQHGVTGFDLPTGIAVLSLSPECTSGAAATNTYTPPAPVLRTVVVGNTISLNAVQMIVQIDRCDAQPCICCSGPVTDATHCGP